jgi:Virulence-associated protein E
MNKSNPMDNIVPFPAQPPLDAYALAMQFLERVLPPEGVYFAGVKTKRGGWRNTPHPTIEALCTYLFEADRGGGDAYFAVASYSSNASRKAENVRELRSFRVDVDYGEGHSSKDAYATKNEALAALAGFCGAATLPEPMVGESGGGLHVFWPLKEALGPDEWRRYSEGLKAACLTHGLGAGHECTADAARVLRMPGTTNRKIPGKPRLVTLDRRFLRIEPYELARFDMLLDYPPVASADKNVEPLRLAPIPPRPSWLPPCEPSPGFPDLYPPADALLIADRCAQLAAMRATRGDHLYEPLWYACLGVLAFCEDGARIAHEWSKGDERYDPKQTQEKIDAWLRMTGPTTCEYFSGCGSKAHELCQGCPEVGKIKSPIQLCERRSSQLLSGDTAADANNKGTKRKPLQWELTQGGAIKPKSYANTDLAIAVLGTTGRHDIFHDRKFIAGDLPENLGPELSDPIVRAVRHAIVARFNFDPSKDNVHEALEHLCDATRFDPVVDYLAGLEWDGRARLDRWLVVYLGAEDTQLNRAFGRKTLVAAVRRARKPGCKFDFMLVLEGPQGAGKSRAVQILAGAAENFSDQPIKWDDPQRQMEAVGGVWIYEIGELVGLGRADVANIKSFLSRQEDRVRPAYGRHKVGRPRRCIFIGTVNGGRGAGYLTDPSGARRFWPVEVGAIDLEVLQRDRNQLWAEAAAVEAKGEPLTIDATLYDAAAVQQELRRAPDPWMDILSDVVGARLETVGGPMERVSTQDLFRTHLQMQAGQMTSATSARLATVMRRLGWDGPKALHLPGRERFKGYERPMPEPSPPQPHGAPRSPSRSVNREWTARNRANGSSKPLILQRSWWCEP